jgi:streptogramin lyase
VVSLLAACGLAASCGSSATGPGPESGEDSGVNFVVDAGNGTDTASQDASAPDAATPDGAADSSPPDTGTDAADVAAGAEATSDGGGPDPTQDVVSPADTGKPPSECVDKDGDGYGQDCFLGKDCDDANPNFTIYCPPCGQQTAEGCKCSQPGASEVCYEGDPGSVGIGECQLGMRTCSNGFWSACTGQVLATAESCDSKDNDCDGIVDEGVLSPCGDCDPFCDTLKVGPDGQEEFIPTEENSEKVGLNIDGYLILDSKKVDLAFIWIANSGANTVSRLDTQKCKETARYNLCSNPSRTSVDLEGNVWVGCRNDGGVAKVAIDEALCIDKNGDGTIQTSKDANGDGTISGGEILPGGADECVLFQVFPGGSCQRSLGVDKDNYAWVGEWYGATLRRLEPEGGQVVDTIQLPTNCYGLVIDQAGIIWVSGRGNNHLIRVDPKTKQTQSLHPGGCFEPYGIGMDYKGRIWIGNCCCSNNAVSYDPATQQWAQVGTNSRPRGIAGNSEGLVFVANDESSRVAIVDADNKQLVGSVELGGGRFPVGIAVDFDGFVWAVNQSASSASKVDPVTKSVVCEVPVGSSPYTYSDMTGYALHNFTAPQGHYSHVFGGWEGFRVKWTAVYIDVNYGDPSKCYVKVRVRTANSKEELAATAWQGYFGPFPPELFPLDLTQIPGMDGKVLEVEVTLFSESKTCTPMVKSIEAKFASEE